MDVEYNNKENIDEEAAVNEEFRALAFPVISTQINVLNLDNHVQEIDLDSNIRIIKLPPIISAETLATLVRSLNLKLKTFLTHVLHITKRKASFYEFVRGGAGVGKSRLIFTLFQLLSKEYNRRAGCDPNSVKLLLCAPTGKAGFGIEGSTLHSMFSLPVYQAGSAFRSLSPELLNTLDNCGQYVIVGFFSRRRLIHTLLYLDLTCKALLSILNSQR